MSTFLIQTVSLKHTCSNNYLCLFIDSKLNVLLDGCRLRKGKSETIFSVNTTKLDQLPLTDFYPLDYGAPNQAFGFTVGPVCFK